MDTFLRMRINNNYRFLWWYILQVLPDDMIVLAPPVPAEMVVAIGQAIKILPQIDPYSMHNRVQECHISLIKHFIFLLVFRALILLPCHLENVWICGLAVNWQSALSWHDFVFEILDERPLQLDGCGEAHGGCLWPCVEFRGRWPTASPFKVGWNHWNSTEIQITGCLRIQVSNSAISWW